MARRLNEARAGEQCISAVLGYEGVNTSHAITGMGKRPELANSGIARLLAVDGVAKARHDAV